MNFLKYTVIAFLLLLPLPRPSFAADAPGPPTDVDSIVAKMIAAGGGEKAVEAMSALHASGRITAFMRQDAGSYDLTFKRPRKLRVETKYARSSETRILHGTTGCRGTDTTPPGQVTGARYLAMVYQYKHLDLLFGLLHRSYKASLSGKSEVSGKPAIVLHLTDQEGPAMNVSVDAATFLVVEVSADFTVADDRTATLAAEFSDYRKVDGLMLPFRLTNLAGGLKIAETVIENYQLNPNIAESLFEP